MQGKRLSLINHDVRSALGDIVGGLALVDATQLDVSSRRQLERVRAAGETLDALLSQMLCATTTDGESPEFEDRGDAEAEDAQDVDLPDLLGTLERRWGGHAAALGHHLDIVCADEVPPRVRVGPIALERILSNLLDNASKYTGVGRIALTVRLEPGGTLVFAVRDSGPGFSDEALARLFTPRGRPPDAARPGTGLGLHIAKCLADGIGGEISVVNRSDPSGAITGACVTLALPAEVWRCDATADRAPQPLPDLTGHHVLLAEDNATTRTLFERMLRQLGARVSHVEDGAAALEALAETDFDLAIVDIRMPRTTGLDVIAATRALSGPRRHVPILAATALVLNADRERIGTAGADAILAKPVLSLSAFAQSVSDALEGAQRRTASLRTAAARPKTCGRTPAPLASRLPQLIDIAGPEGSAELLRRLDDDVSTSVESLRRAVTTRDIASVRADSHVLISLTGTVGAAALQSTMEQVNSASHRGDWTFLDTILAATQPALDGLCREIQQFRYGLCYPQ